MKKRTLLYIVAILIVAGYITYNHIIKKRCAPEARTPEKIEAVNKATQSLTKWLTDSGENVIILARRGQDLTQYNMEFSHVSFVKKTNDTWEVHHLLNDICPSAIGRLATETLEEFLFPITDEYRVAAVIPNQILQQQLSDILADDQEKLSMFEENYSSVAYPFSNENQNSNGWVIEIFAKAVAEYPLINRNDAINWLQQNEYKPDHVPMGLIKQWIANILVPNATLRGHPKSLRDKGELWLNSSDSVLNFIAKYSIKPKECENNTSTLDENVCILSL